MEGERLKLRALRCNLRLRAGGKEALFDEETARPDAALKPMLQEIGTIVERGPINSKR